LIRKSALMKRRYESAVEEWMDRQTEALWTTSISIMEIRTGIEVLATGRHRQRLEAAFARCLREDLEERVWDFDREAANEAGILSARRGLAGMPLDFRHIEIAGIVASRRATLATRNIRHFDKLGIDLVNSWILA
jgi:toxin FitB